MKRQKKVAGNGPAMATRRKEKRKVEEEPVAEKSVVVEEKGDERENVAVAKQAEMSMDWDEGPQWWWGVVDEQMSWGSFWCPSWDIEYFGEAYADALYSDVVWDYDVWDLGGINEVPL